VSTKVALVIRFADKLIASLIDPKSDGLDAPLTQAINNQPLTISQAYINMIEKLLPLYTVLGSDVR